jgi:hypothetical protein
VLRLISGSGLTLGLGKEKPLVFGDAVANQQINSQNAPNQHSASTDPHRPSPSAADLHAAVSARVLVTPAARDDLCSDR